MALRKKQFTLAWFKEFGWINNPFRLEIFNPIDRYIAGLEKERQKLNYFIIENFPYGTIKADKGAGKTMLLLWLKQSLNEYKGTIVVDYYKAEKRGVSLSEQTIDNLTGIGDRLVMGSLFKLRLKKLFYRKKNIETGQAEPRSVYEALYHRNFAKFEELLPFFEKKLKKQRLVLLVDDSHLLSEKDVSFIQFLLSSNLPVQVIATLDSQGSLKVENKDVLKMKLSEISYKEMKDFIEKRIQSVGGNGVEPFNEHIIHSIYSKSKKNPLSALKICYDQAVKLALKHRSDIKKGIIPKKERAQPEEEFDEIAEYNKLLAQDRKKHDVNTMVMGASIEEKKEEKSTIKSEIKKTSKESSTVSGSSATKNIQKSSQVDNSYSIQVMEHDSTQPIEIIGHDSKNYSIKEVRKSSSKSVKKKVNKKAVPTKKQSKTRRKKSTKHRSHKKATKKTTKKKRHRRK